MTAGGYVKIWRKMLDSEVFQDDWLCRLWMWCILKAQWQQVDRKGVPDRGSFHTGRIAAASELKVAPSKWYRGIERLRELGCITVESNSNRTTITLCNYVPYQDSTCESEQQTDSKRTASEQLPLEEEGKKERKQDAPAAKNATRGDLATAKPAAEDAARGAEDHHSPEWLARMWVHHRRGTNGRNELDRATTTFQEMIRLGCTGAQIAAEITRKERRRTEPIWDFEKRLMASSGVEAGRKKGQFDGIRAWMEGGNAQG